MVKIRLVSLSPLLSTIPLTYVTSSSSHASYFQMYVTACNRVHPVLSNIYGISRKMLEIRGFATVSLYLMFLLETLLAFP